jgi:hypothetical protein
MTEQKFYISAWRAEQWQQCDSPQFPRQPWYFPFRSEQACRECAAQGDVVAIERVRAHDKNKVFKD